MRRPIARDQNQRKRAVSSQVSSWLNFSPLSFNPQLWLDASDTSTITESGGAVSQWNDKSGNAHNVTQATGAAQPTTNLNTINQKNVLKFDGGDVMSGPMAVNAGSVTVFVVAKETTEVNFAGLLVLAPSSGSDQTTTNGLVTHAGGLGIIFESQRNASQSVLALSGVSPLGVYVGRFASGGLTESFSNTATAATSTASGTFGNSTTALVGGRYQSGSISASFRFNGDIGEIIVYSATLTNNQMNSVGYYLSQKWGLIWTNK